ncbi:MAG: glutathione S-transferase family protein [Deltaproteobacteria bacterium]|nr:glutathione S-transferase family protein [Deltaproteobacteria bacterium]
MTTNDNDPGTYTLWGAAHSYYTGKIRSYLLKKRVAFRELHPSHPDFQARILPAVRHWVVPIMETPEGEILQDSSDMIAHLEARFAQPQMIPDTPVQRAVAWLLGAFGSEALLPAGMSYRWSYRAEQERFLSGEFGRAVYAGPDREARHRAGLRIMDYFNDFLPILGVTPETIATVETAYCELLDALDVHFQNYPYLLGGRPSIADFGFMAPLYAHLSRDPVPATLMKNRAQNVYRWTERMNLASIADGEFGDCPESYPANDEIPPTLEPVLRLIFQDWGAELLANAAFFNAWIASNPSLPVGQVVCAGGNRKVHPTLGFLDYQWRGRSIRRHSLPHALWRFDEAAECARSLRGDARARFDALVQRTGGEQVMAIRLARPMKRQDYVLVLA